MKLQTLYKKNSKGSIQQWSIFVDGNKFWAEYGLVGGTIQADSPTTCEGKNLGKKNETSPEDQAKLEAESKIRKQKDKGYAESVGEIEDKRFTPMLSHEFGKHGHKLPEWVLVSPKLDGVRSIFTKNGAFSRNNKEFISAKFINEDLKEVFEKCPNMIIDGEIYNHEFKEDFNKIISLVKKSVKVTEEEWKDISDHLQLHIFDFYFPDLPDQTFLDRQTMGRSILELFAVKRKRIHFVTQEYCHKKQVDTKHEEYLERGYEGIMLRDPDSPYEFKRSYHLQKYKNFIDEEFKIVGLEEGKGNWAGKCMAIIFHNEEGKEFKATPKGTEEYRAKLLLDKRKICGKMATVKYQNRTPDNAPRFGVVTAIRDYE
jgi:ATP-dependent DNA ligase